MTVNLEELEKIAENIGRNAGPDTYAEAIIQRFAPRLALAATTSLTELGAAGTGTIAAETATGVVGLVSGIVALAAVGATLGTFWLSSRLVKDAPRKGPFAKDFYNYLQQQQEVHSHIMHETLSSSWDFIENLGGSMKKATTGLTAIYGIPSLVGMGAAHTVQTSPLHRLPYDVNSLTNRLAESVQNMARRVTHDLDVVHRTMQQVWKWIHTVLQRLDHLQHQIQVQARHITKISVQVQHQAKTINRLEREVKHLTKQLTKEIHINKEQTKRIGHHTYRLDHSEDLLTAVAMGFTALSLLAPLVATGEEGVATLTELASDPCRCFKIPGSDAWLLKMAVAWLYWDNE